MTNIGIEKQEEALINNFLLIRFTRDPLIKGTLPAILKPSSDLSIPHMTSLTASLVNYLSGALQILHLL